MSTSCNAATSIKGDLYCATHALPTAHVSLGAYGRVPHEIAIADAVAHPPVDPLLGKLSTQKLQLCPQNLGCLDQDVATALRHQYPEVEWRLHANVRIRQEHQFIDLCDWREQRSYFQALKGISQVLSAPVYSAHAGKRANASVQDVIRNSLEITQAFGIPVAIEGHYPTARNIWLFSSWEEYQQLLESDAFIALDLSHLHILATQSRRIEWTLVQELLACDRCLEIHVSGNDGSRDQHQLLDPAHKPWWFELLAFAHDKAVVFSEGYLNQRNPFVTSVSV